MIDNNRPHTLANEERPVGGCLDDEPGNFHPHNQLSVPAPAGEVILFAANRPQYLKTLAAHKDAESFLKITELSSPNTGLYIPSINELRYYGYHLNKAYETKDPAEQLEELKRAERHCQRASYDSLELALIGALKAISSFNAFYRTAAVTDVVKEYPALLVEVEQIKEYIANNSSDDRTEHYQECSEKLKRLKEISLLLECSRSSLNGKIRQTNINWGLQIVAAIFAGILMTVAVIKFFKVDLAQVNAATTTTLQAQQSPPNSKRGRLDPLP